MNKEQLKFSIKAFGYSILGVFKAILFQLLLVGAWIIVSKIFHIPFTKINFIIFVVLLGIITAIQTRLKKKDGLRHFKDLVKSKDLLIIEKSKGLKDYLGILDVPDIALKKTNDSNFTFQIWNDGSVIIKAPTIISEKYKLFNDDPVRTGFKILGMSDEVTDFEIVEKTYGVKPKITDDKLKLLIEEIYRSINFYKMDILKNEISIFTEIGSGVFGSNDLPQLLDDLYELINTFEKIESDLILRQN